MPFDCNGSSLDARARSVIRDSLRPERTRGYGCEETRRCFCLVRLILVRYVSMISREEQRTMWINAYNAAMTGLLSAKAAHMERYTENSASVITEQCKAFADQALKDVAAYASDMLE
jgi:hypothetical protein